MSTATRPMHRAEPLVGPPIAGVRGGFVDIVACAYAERKRRLSSLFLILDTLPSLSSHARKRQCRQPQRRAGPPWRPSPLAPTAGGARWGMPLPLIGHVRAHGNGSGKGCPMLPHMPHAVGTTTQGDGIHTGADRDAPMRTSFAPGQTLGRGMPGPPPTPWMYVFAEAGRGRVGPATSPAEDPN